MSRVCKSVTGNFFEQCHGHKKICHGEKKNTELEGIVLLATCDLSVILLMVLDSVESMGLLSTGDDLDSVDKHEFGHASRIFANDLYAI